jgi:hypothetical protein
MKTREFGSYRDFNEVDQELMQKALTVAHYYCYDAVNLISTSGMYPAWRISVSPECTVYLARKAPVGHGGHLNNALLDFVADCERKAKEAEEYDQKINKNAGEIPKDFEKLFQENKGDLLA